MSVALCVIVICLHFATRYSSHNMVQTIWCLPPEVLEISFIPLVSFQIFIEEQTLTPVTRQTTQSTQNQVRLILPPSPLTLEMLFVYIKYVSHVKKLLFISENEFSPEWCPPDQSMKVG